MGRIISFLTTIALPVLLLAAAIGLLLVTRRRRRSRGLLVAAISLAMAAVLVAAVTVYATRIEPEKLQLRKVTIRTDKVERPVRIVHISDIQSASVGNYERKVFRRIKELEPDIVFFTGDLLQPIRPATFESELPKISDLLRELGPPMGLYGVTGDTDGRFADEGTEEIGGMTLLSNEEAEVRGTGVSLRILGLTLWQSRYSDSRYSDVSRRVLSWLNQGNTDDFTIVLGHDPDYAMGLTDMPVDLCLAGHTHGGQIRLPLIGPIINVSQVPRAWVRGYRNIGRTRLNVSAGIGCFHRYGLPSIRFNCPPEITLIELRPE